MFISMFENPMKTTTVLIAILGILLMLLNVIMALKYKDIVSKFMNLLNAQEQDKSYVLLRKMGMNGIFCLLLFRALSEDMMRFGSALNIVVFGDNYTHYVLKDPGSGWIILINASLFI